MCVATPGMSSSSDSIFLGESFVRLAARDEGDAVDEERHHRFGITAVSR
jgi:hypothetical protein